MSKRLATPHHKAPAGRYVGMVEPIVESQAEQTLTSHEDGLLERARTQWQFGDWESLAQIDRDTLQHHPDRAKLALLAAAGRLQTEGNDSEARQFIRLAQSWGASKKLINQILIAGVHNSLGRAAAISNQQQQAFQHFEKAIAVGIPGSDTKLLTRARSSEQLGQLGLPASENCARTEMSEITAAVPESPSFTKNLETIVNTLGQQKVEFDAQFKKQADELIRMRKFLDSTLKKEVANAAKQVEAFIALQSYFATGELPCIDVERNGWPISPDFAFYLVKLLELNDYDLVIEFGSGFSTTIIARTLANIAVRHVDRSLVELVSFDHLKYYYQQTRSYLVQADLLEKVQLHYVPLANWQAPNGSIQPYYTCQTILAALAQKYRATAGLRILAVVDGPPAATCKYARYPALPLILQHFAGAQIDFLLDDYAREDEKEIVYRWKNEIIDAQLTYSSTEFNLEKDACLIQVQGLKSSREQISLES